MKAVVLLASLACTLGLPQLPPGTSLSAATAASQVAAAAQAGATNRQGLFGGGSGIGGQQRANMQNWGPKAYGPGLNNPWAFPLNPFQMQRAVALADSCPGTLVKVEVTGEVVITDQHGFEVEIVDWFGNDLTEGIEEFEHPEPQFVIGGPPGFGGAGFGGAPGLGGAPGAAGFRGAAGPGAAGAGRPPCFRRPSFL